MTRPPRNGPMRRHCIPPYVFGSICWALSAAVTKIRETANKKAKRWRDLFTLPPGAPDKTQHGITCSRGDKRIVRAGKLYSNFLRCSRLPILRAVLKLKLGQPSEWVSDYFAARTSTAGIRGGEKALARKRRSFPAVAHPVHIRHYRSSGVSRTPGPYAQSRKPYPIADMTR